MIFLIISSINTGNVPPWLAFTICVLIFIAASVVSGFAAYKYRLGKLRKEREINETETSEDKLP